MNQAYQRDIELFQALQSSAGFFKMSLSKQTDTEVYQALRSGNLSALGIIYDRYGGVVYGLALRILGNAAEAEDLTQEVFLTLSRSSNYDAKRGSMIVFLTTITRSRAINRLRQVRSQNQLLQKWERNISPDNTNNLMEKASLSEIRDRVGEALLELPENQRQVLEMAYYDGLSQSEITQQLNVPLGTVKTRTRQGLLKLRKLLKDLVE
ncbi:MAG: sigma-70 family RNA polymerase sigma factor [Heteroscytonema crispum UTEX LB 1556]